MTKIILFSLNLMFLFQSCSLIHFMGTKQIEDKSEQDIQLYLKDIDFKDYDYSFLLPKDNLDSLDAKRHVLDLWKYDRQTEQSTIQIRIYDSTGKLLNGYAQCYGEMNRINILAEKEFKQFKQFPNNFDLVFEDELSLLDLSKDIQSEILDISKIKKYTIVIYWNIWSNYYSRVIFKNLEKYLKKYKNRDDFLIILVNTDNIPDLYKNQWNS